MVDFIKVFLSYVTFAEIKTNRLTISLIRILIRFPIRWLLIVCIRLLSVWDSSFGWFWLWEQFGNWCPLGRSYWLDVMRLDCFLRLREWIVELVCWQTAFKSKNVRKLSAFVVLIFLIWKLNIPLYLLDWGIELKGFFLNLVVGISRHTVIVKVDKRVTPNFSHKPLIERMTG